MSKNNTDILEEKTNNYILREKGSVKPSYDEQRCVLGKVLPLDAPFRVCLEISEKCNFKCNYCFRSGKDSEKWGRILPNMNMSMEMFQLAVQQLKEFSSMPKVLALSSCGEPLCNEHIIEMVKYLKKEINDIKIEITTNASLLSKYNIEELAGCGIDKIIISLQGLDSKTYEQICGVAINFDQFYDNIALLYANKSINTNIFIKIVDSAICNKEHEERFFSLFSSVADRVYIEKIVPIWKEQLYNEPLNETINKYGEDFGKIECCPGPFTNFIVSPVGAIWPCCYNHPPICFGNIQEITLKDAWNSINRKEFLRQQLIDKDYYTQCATCYLPQVYVKTEQDIISLYKNSILEKLK